MAIFSCESANQTGAEILRTLSGHVEAIFLKLIHGLEKPGDHRSIDNSTGFMPVVVECVEAHAGGKMYSVAHYGKQSGDLMADPEVCLFLTNSGKIAPFTFRNDYVGVSQIAARFTDGGIHCNEKLQGELCDVCIEWFRNVAEQQDID